MKITEVRIKLMDDPHERLQAFCSITFDSCFVVRDLKIIQGTKGAFVAMPSRKLTDRCPKCYMKNHLRATHCNQCGTQLDESRATRDTDGRAKLYADIAHPIKSECREMIQTGVLEAYERELVLSQDPGYVCSYDDYGEECFAALHESEESAATEPARQPAFFANGVKTHRIEPAETTPTAPHSLDPAPARFAPLQSAANNEDSFGAGIV